MFDVGCSACPITDNPQPRTLFPMTNLLTRLQFNSEGHIPAVIVDTEDGAVLTLCYFTKEALEKTLETGLVHVFRRSKGRLMVKGETSGHVQHVKEVRLDCEGKSLAIKVEQEVAACHQGYKTCYFERYNPATDGFEITEKRVFDPDQVYK